MFSTPHLCSLLYLTPEPSVLHPCSFWLEIRQIPAKQSEARGYSGGLSADTIPASIPPACSCSQDRETCVCVKHTSCWGPTYTHTHKYPNSHTLSYTNVHILTHIMSCIYTHVYAYTRACTHLHTTHSLTHTCTPPQPSSRPTAYRAKKGSWELASRSGKEPGLGERLCLQVGRQDLGQGPEAGCHEPQCRPEGTGRSVNEVGHGAGPAAGLLLETAWGRLGRAALSSGSSAVLMSLCR